MPTRARISVIIPTYNRVHCVGEAIDSVLAQDPPADEVIVVDDGSTDATPERLAGYGDRITVIRQENAGAGAARTAGLGRARGDWITFLDSDDIWLPGRLALLHHDLGRPEASGIAAHFADHRMTGDGYAKGFFDLRGYDIPDGGVEVVEDPFARSIPGFSLDSYAVRADVAARTAGFPAELGIEEDGYFFCAVALLGPMLLSNTIVAEVRRLSGDGDALVELLRTDPLRARRLSQRRLDLVAELPMSEAQRELVQRHASGHLLEVARAEAEAGDGRPRRTLLRMARSHPRPLVGWAKALPPLLLGRLGYRLLPRRPRAFSRVTAPSRPGTHRPARGA